MDLDKIFNNRPLYKTPWFVMYISITIIAQFFLINFKENFTAIDADTFTLFGAPDTVDIYRGQFWGVFTNNFIHTQWKPLLVNLVGLWFFGAFIERRIGYLRLMSLMFLGCVIPSLWQLALTTEPGIGLSGVNYVLFGYILVRSRKGETFKLKGLYLFLTFMLGVLVYCNYVNIFIENVYRTEAMTVGLLLGMLLARLRYGKKIYRVLLISGLSLLSVSTLFYAPWSSEWQVYKGVKCYERRDFQGAKMYYEKALEIDSTNELAIDNLKLIVIDKLKSKAYDAHIRKNYTLAKKYYLEILQKDPNDSWAKENLNALP